MIAFLSLASLVLASGKEVSVQDKIQGALFGSLVADALCLGSHYEYDAKVIKQAYAGTIERYMGPGEAMGGTTHGVGWGRRNYHPGQKAGDQTDYGEYNLLGLEFLASRSGSEGQTSPIRLEALIPYWRERVTKAWGAWLCTQTKQTLQQVSSNVPYDKLGGNSNAMSLRHAAAYAVFDKEEDIVKAARTMMFTHRNPEALGGGEFFGRVAFRIIHKGQTPRQAIEDVAAQMSSWFSNKAKQGIAKFEEATDTTKSLREKMQSWPTALNAAKSVENGGHASVFLVRIAPVPCVVKNYALSLLTDIPWTVFVPGTLLGLLPTTAAHVYAGTLAPSSAELMTGSGAAMKVVAAASTVGAVAFIGLLAAYCLQQQMPEDDVAEPEEDGCARNNATQGVTLYTPNGRVKNVIQHSEDS